jgi:ATP-dependent HslUV protease ATP-binding subunit HslU
VPIYLPEATQTSTESLTPRQIVAELDKYVIGQNAAKRAVAIALRNRYRRQRLPADMAEEVAPKNILMIGPTGVGKTEIARRLARLAESPFIKVEASKFTEVGYVGRDVESMVRDLVELGIDMVREERIEEVRSKAAQNAEDRLLDLLLPPTRPTAPDEDPAAIRDQQNRTRERIREQLQAGQLDTRVVEIDAREKAFPSLEIVAGSSIEEIDINLKDMLPGLFQGKTKKRHESAQRLHLTQEEEQPIDMDSGQDRQDS